MITTTTRFTNRAGANVRVVWHDVAGEGGWRWQCVGCPQNSGFLASEGEAKQQAQSHAETCEAS